MDNIIRVIIVYTLFLVISFLLFLYEREKGKLKHIDLDVKDVVFFLILWGIAFNLIGLVFLYIYGLNANRWVNVSLVILVLLYIIHIVITCITLKYRSKKLVSLSYAFIVVYLIIEGVCVFIPTWDSIYLFSGDVYEYQTSTIDCHSGLFEQDLGDVSVYYDNKGLNLFQTDDALTIVSEGYKGAKFNDNDIEYILSKDIFWSYNGVSYIPVEELNNLDSGLVKINITYENNELKEFIPESIELIVLNENTVYCKATDGYATVSTAFNVK